MNQDEQQLQLLSLFHYVCAGIVALFSCIPIVHLVIGLMLVTRPEAFGPAKDPPPALFGWLFAGIGAALILFGWTLAALLAWAGRCLKLRVHHTYCCIAAGVACMFMPLGTVLGIFTLLVLMRPSVKALFNAPTQPAVAA